MKKGTAKGNGCKVTKRPTTAAVMRIQAKSPRKRYQIDNSNDIFAQTTVRPKTRAETLKLKEWRSAKFHNGGTASKREVELLGEWLNSVLAENLETTENPIDVVTNAQHWYSVAFNELVRQVSICCAERGRLFAVIWKRNQDLFTKMIELHKQEREYILKCHKERVQFLKTDLEFCGSRYKTIYEAYQEELKRWEESSERDITKFDALQQKINQQAEDRSRLMKQINSYKEKLHIPYVVAPEHEEILPNVYTYDDLCTKLREADVLLQTPGKAKMEDLDKALQSLELFLNHNVKSSLSYRHLLEHCFLSIPNTDVPVIRKEGWLKAAISFLYTDYMSALGRKGPSNLMKKPFVDFCLESFISLFGSRSRAERTFLDLVATTLDFVNQDDASSRYISFASFLGLKNPSSLDTLHFYLFSLATLLKNNSPPLFPEVDAGESMVCAVPQQAILTTANQVLGKLINDKMLKFYTQRIEKVAMGGTLRFGGRQIAELDEILEYMLTFYTEEAKNYEDKLLDFWKSLNIDEIESYTQFRHIMSRISDRLTSGEIAKMYNDQIKKTLHMKLNREDFMDILRKNNFLLPLKFIADDFPRDPSIEDMIPFIQQEFADVLPIYDKTIERLLMFGDELQAKSLKASKIKYEQSISGHCTAKIFETNIRDFFEKLDLANFI